MIHKTIPVTIDFEKQQIPHDNYQADLHTYVLESSEEMPGSFRRPAVIINPGGAYRFKSDREAENVAMRFLSSGIQAFVLQYRVAPNRYPGALLELAASVAHVRSHAEEYFTDPDKIFILGFSAGGHLTSCLGNLWDAEFITDALKDSFSWKKDSGKPWKPDGMILCYPVISMGEFTHEESRRLLLGDDFTPEQIEETSMELHVSEKTVPTFLWHTQEDGDVPVENSLLFATALRKARVPFELHIFERGPHGLSLADATSADGNRIVPEEVSIWSRLAINWLLRQ